MRSSLNVGTRVGPFYVGTRITPGRSPYGQRASVPVTPARVRPAQTPRTPRRTTIPMPATVSTARRVATHQPQPLYRMPLAPFPAQRPVQPAAHGTPTVRPSGFYWCVALAMVLGTVLMITLCTMAVHMTPQGVPGIATTPSVTAPHTVAAHTTTGHRPAPRPSQK